MKTLYIECGMGAAGDMLGAALFELLTEDERGAHLLEMNQCRLPEVTVEAVPVKKCGIQGTGMRVLIRGVEELSEDVKGERIPEHYHDHEHDHLHDHHDHDHDHHGNHHHASLADIQQIIRATTFSDAVKGKAYQVYCRIAEAESAAHGKRVEEIHFHEVGAMDAVADVLNACRLMERLAPEKVLTSPVNTGFGAVRCAHGIMPVPAPATAFLLRDVPIYSGMFEGEMCTPTGAALLTEFTDDFGQMPCMKVQKIGYGMGHKDFPRANCVRAFLGETAEEKKDQIIELSCNLDDMTGEELAYACERIREAGALDVFLLPIQMKKNRPGQMLSVLVRPSDEASIVRVIMKLTTTWGIRRNVMERYVLERDTATLQTELGQVTIKSGSGYGSSKSKPEYDDLAKLALQLGISVQDVKKRLGL